MQIGDWGNVLIDHVREWKHQKHLPWVSVFRGRIPWCFSLSKSNISPAAPDLELRLFPLWYWPTMNAHTKQQQNVWTGFYWQSKILPPFCAPFGSKSCMDCLSSGQAWGLTPGPGCNRVRDFLWIYYVQSQQLCRLTFFTFVCTHIWRSCMLKVMMLMIAFI